MQQQYIIVFILFVIAGMILKDYLYPPKEPVPKPKRTSPLTPADRPGTNWYNEWLMERELIKELPDTWKGLEEYPEPGVIPRDTLKEI